MTANRPDKSRLYYPVMPTVWWFRKWHYFLFLLRELTSVFIAAYLVLFLVQLYRLSQGPAAYASFSETLKSPGWIAFHGVALLFAVYHSITWFITAAVILTPKVGNRVVPPWLVTWGHIVAWIAVSGVILALFIVPRS